jgi:hypothetical protein
MNGIRTIAFAIAIVLIVLSVIMKSRLDNKIQTLWRFNFVKPKGFGKLIKALQQTRDINHSDDTNRFHVPNADRIVRRFLLYQV